MNVSDALVNTTLNILYFTIEVEPSSIGGIPGYQPFLVIDILGACIILSFWKMRKT